MAETTCPSCTCEVYYSEDLAQGPLSCPVCGTVFRLGPPVEPPSDAVFATTEQAEPSVPAVQEVEQPADDSVEPPLPLPARLPRPLGDPLRLYRRLFSVVLVLQLLYVAVAAVIVAHSRGWRDVKWLNLNLAVVLWVLPFILCFWRILPGRAVNAFYLRSFRKDPRTVSIRNDAQEALGWGFRLSGIRDPRRRWPAVVRYLNAFIFALRQATPRYMSLEAGADWKARLWRSLGEARCALIDVT